MKSAFTKRLIMDLHQDIIGQAVTINTLRAKLNTMEVANNEMALAQVEGEPAVAALDEWEGYLMEKVRLEREACAEPGMWARTPMGNSVALTLYQDLANQLVRVRRNHGI